MRRLCACLSIKLEVTRSLCICIYSGKVGVVVDARKFACSNKVVCQISSESGFPCLAYQTWKVRGRKVGVVALVVWVSLRNSDDEKMYCR